MNLLIDGSSLLWRTHYVNISQHKEGASNNIYLFLKSIKSYADMYGTKNIYVAWDKKLGTESNFRLTETNGEYKGQRNADTAASVYECQEELHNALKLIGCVNIYPWIMEADNIISWLSRTLDGYNIVITTDSDMLQLINDNTCVYNPQKKNTIDKNNFTSVMGMPIEHYLAYKAILGDTSDNIKGIHGCGPVGSKKLAKIWVETPELVEEERAETIKKNIKLMDLSIGYTINGEKELEVYNYQLDNYKHITADFENFESFCKKHNFKSILQDMSKWKSTFNSSILLDLLLNLPV